MKYYFSPCLQLLPVHPGAHVHTPGELHVPPLRQPPEQKTINAKFTLC